MHDVAVSAVGFIAQQLRPSHPDASLRPRLSAFSLAVGLFVFFSCPRPAAAWESSAYDKLSIGQTTEGETEAILGKPDRSRRPFFSPGTKRWDYFSTTRAGLPGRTIVLDFTDGRLARKGVVPDGVEERRGFVLDFGVGAASAKTTGSRRVNASETAIGFSAGWAPRDRFAILLDVLGCTGSTTEQNVGGLGLRFFPVIPWYVQADYLATTEVVYAPPHSYLVDGRGFSVRTGYELGFSRWGALVPELFLMRTHSWAPEAGSPAGAAADLRSTVWGALIKYAWYP